MKVVEREHLADPVSHGCCTEEMGTVVSLWNLVGMCCAVLQRKKGARWAPNLA